MHIGRPAAIALLMLSLTAGAPAQELPQAAYGGSGEDILRELVACEDGLFAAGTTASDDYDLDMRTRRGETGWALRLDANGKVRFSYCSARSGMTRMTAPAAFENGTYAVTLTDETGQRGEWIVLDERGSQLSRVPLPEIAALCAQGSSILQTMSVQTAEGAALAVIVSHAQGGACCALIGQDGNFRKIAELPGAFGRAAYARGVIACVCAEDDALCVHYPAFGEEMELMRRIPLEDVQIARIADMTLGEDASVALCGETSAGGGFLLRMSREGELLFLREMDAPLDRLTETDTGFACLSGEKVFFADEDGGKLGIAAAPENTLDLAASSLGAAALSHIDARGRRQAMLTHIAQPEAIAQEMAEIQPVQMAEIAMGEGRLLCSAQDALGVQVRHVAADGTEFFSTRTPIHTAADALEWLCAAVLEDGSILLGGRYLTGEGDAVRQEGVCALLTQGGVLRRMEMVAGAGAVCAIEITQAAEILLHAAQSEVPSLEADTIHAYSLEKIE